MLNQGHTAGMHKDPVCTYRHGLLQTQPTTPFEHSFLQVVGSDKETAQTGHEASYSNKQG